MSVGAVADVSLANETADGQSVLTIERAALVEADDALEHMKDVAEHIADYGVDELASQSLGRIRAQRLAALAADPGVPAFFGRIDTVAQDDNGEESFHIGRRHIRDAQGDPLVIDWRAPMSRGFYRATASDPMGVRRRRRFGFADRLLTSFEDEQLSGPGAATADASTSELLQREIERPRSGPMRDIVATISPDQDDLVRADLDRSLCIQGAPGTGKTAVGLHRAAFLLYTYPERLQRAGVLVVGPNEGFLRYIEAVLPTLGEAGVRQATIDNLVGNSGARTEPADVATVKGDARFAPALARALLRYVAKPVDDVVVTGGSLGTRRFRVTVDRLRRFVDDARREVAAGTLRWDVGRDRIATLVAHEIRRQREDAGGAPSDRETASLRRNRAVTGFLDASWPSVSADKVLEALLGDRDLLDRCARELTDEERQLVHRAPQRRRAWTSADAVLLDELRWLIAGGETFGHIVIDEAQDLSPMQCRALARRCPTGSFTVLGDLAQATTPWAPGRWAITLTALGQADMALQPLTTGYRVPARVLELANRLLPLIAADLSPATSLRDSPEALALTDRAGLALTVEDALGREGTVGVIVAAPDLTAVTAELGTAIELAGERLVLVAADLAKGLEFDTVVLVDPAAVVAAEPTPTVGLRRLYVVLTRAVSRLVICGSTAGVPALDDPARPVSTPA